MSSIPAFEDILLPYFQSYRDPLSTPMATSETVHSNQQTICEKASDHEFMAGQLAASPFGAFHISAEDFSRNSDVQLNEVPSFEIESVRDSHNYFIPTETHRVAEQSNSTKHERANNDLGRPVQAMNENVGLIADSVTQKNYYQSILGFSSHLNASAVAHTPVTMSLLSDAAPGLSDFTAVTDTFIDRSQTFGNFTKKFESSSDTNNVPSVQSNPLVNNNFVSTLASANTKDNFKSDTNSNQIQDISKQPTSKKDEPLSYTEKIAERRRRNRESSSKCYYNRKRIKDQLDAEINTQKCRLMQLYDRALELRHENARLKRAIVTSGISLPIQKKAGRVARGLKL